MREGSKRIGRDVSHAIKRQGYWVFSANVAMFTVMDIDFLRLINATTISRRKEDNNLPKNWSSAIMEKLSKFERYFELHK